MAVIDCAAELSTASLGDRRRQARAVAISEVIQQDPSLSFPSMFTPAELEAFYRFTNNDEVEAPKLLEPHFRETMKRAATGERHVVVHDTTELSFPGDAERSGLHFTGTRNTLQLHVSLSVELCEAPVVHGVASLRAYVLHKGGYREVLEGGDTVALQVGSQRWIDGVKRVHSATDGNRQLIHVMDREADDFMLWHQIMETGGDFVIRAAQDRRIAGTDSHLFNMLNDAAISFERTVHVSARSRRGRAPNPAHPPRDAREARLSVRSGTVDIRRAKKLRQVGPETLRLNMVEVVELNPPQDEDAVSWVLITTLPIDSHDDVADVIDIYRKRWLIEEYFKALKSGCRLEERQAESSWSVMNVVALLVPIAVRLLQIRAFGRHPETAVARTVLDDVELDALRAMPRAKLPRKPTNRDVMLAIARLGGLLKQNGEPGWIILGRGYAKFLAFLEGWRAGLAAPRKPKKNDRLRRSDR